MPTNLTFLLPFLSVFLSPSPSSPPTLPPGGTAFNAVAEELKQWTHRVAHVLPVSDNGGSTAEIVRVMGERRGGGGREEEVGVDGLVLLALRLCSSIHPSTHPLTHLISLSLVPPLLSSPRPPNLPSSPQAALPSATFARAACACRTAARPRHWQ